MALKRLRKFIKEEDNNASFSGTDLDIRYYHVSWNLVSSCSIYRAELWGDRYEHGSRYVYGLVCLASNVPGYRSEYIRLPHHSRWSRRSHRYLSAGTRVHAGEKAGNASSN